MHNIDHYENRFLDSKLIAYVGQQIISCVSSEIQL